VTNEPAAVQTGSDDRGRYADCHRPESLPVRGLERALHGVQLAAASRRTETLSGQILVKIASAGACHSDLHIFETTKPAGQSSFRLPFTLGHENAGWVDKLGSGTTGFAPTVRERRV
jgi:hypothetical protein